MPPKPSYKRGDVILVLYPNSDLRTAKTRPALIVQADNLQTGLPQVIVAMITSRLFRANHPSRVVVEVSTHIGQRSGLLTDSVVMTDNLATVAEVAIRGGLDLELRALQWLYGCWLPRSGFVPDDQPAFEAWLGRPFAHGTEYFELAAQLPIRRG